MRQATEGKYEKIEKNIKNEEMKEGNGEAVSFFHFSLIRTVGYAEGTLVRQKKQ